MICFASLNNDYDTLREQKSSSSAGSVSSFRRAGRGRVWNTGIREDGTATCPSCDGIGKVPEDKKKHLVALIPADDERLKPSNTKSWVSLSVAVSLLAAFLAFYFVYPRSFELLPPSPDIELLPKDYSINPSEEIVSFIITDYWTMVNPNYYSITLHELKVQAYLNRIVSETQNDTSISIPLQSRKKITQDIQITFKDDLGYLVKFCNDPRPWVHTTYMRFQATAQVSIMGYSITKIVETYQRVSCGKPDQLTIKRPGLHNPI